MTFWGDFELESFPVSGDLDGLTLEEAFHRSLHTNIGEFLTEMQFALMVPRSWTPVLHTDGSPDFQRGTGGGGVRGQSWGIYFQMGKWVWGQGTIRLGDTGWNKGNGNYYMTLPVPGVMPPTEMPRIGEATIGSGANFKHYNWGLHMGRVNAPDETQYCCFTPDDGVFMWATGGLYIPDFTSAGGDIHTRFGPYLAA
jgi:hypothetical protein